MTSRAIFQIEDIFSITGRGIIISGTLEEGVIQKGMKTNINGKEAEILSIEQFNKTINELNEKNSKADLLLSGVKKRIFCGGKFILDKII